MIDGVLERLNKREGLQGRLSAWGLCPRDARNDDRTKQGEQTRAPSDRKSVV